MSRRPRKQELPSSFPQIAARIKALLDTPLHWVEITQRGTLPQKAEPVTVTVSDFMASARDGRSPAQDYFDVLTRLAQLDFIEPMVALRDGTAPLISTLTSEQLPHFEKFQDYLRGNDPEREALETRHSALVEQLLADDAAADDEQSPVNRQLDEVVRQMQALPTVSERLTDLFNQMHIDHDSEMGQQMGAAVLFFGMAETIDTQRQELAAVGYQMKQVQLCATMNQPKQLQEACAELRDSITRLNELAATGTELASIAQDGSNFSQVVQQTNDICTPALSGLAMALEQILGQVPPDRGITTPRSPRST